MSNNNLISLAGNVGSSIGGKLAQKAFEELELAFVTKLLPKKFTNVPTLRTRQHILLYWRKGFLKTTILREFSKVIPSRFKTVQITSATTETLNGSLCVPRNPFEKPRIVPPIFAGLDFAVITEHSTFLRYGGPMPGKLAILNDIQEGDRISTHLIKLGQTQVDPAQEEELEKLGVKYEPQEATLSYEPDVVLFSGSHPFDQRTLALLVDSGHLDRFRVVQARITAEMAKNCFNGEHGLNIEALEQLRKRNEELSKVKVELVETIPPALLKLVLDRVFDLTRIPDYRILGDLHRCAAAFMVLRHFAQGNLREAYVGKDYANDDAEFLLQKVNDFVEPRLNPIMSNGYAKLGKMRVRDHAKRHVLIFLEASSRQGRNGESLASIHLYVCERIPGVHFQTINNGLRELLKEGRIERVLEKYGYYRIVKKGET
jgi:hypothetical protein